MAKIEEKSSKKEGTNLLGAPTFTELDNGRFKCVETGHEVLAKDRESYSHSKRCRSGLIGFALSQNKPPLNIFKQDPLSRYQKFPYLCVSSAFWLSSALFCEKRIWKPCSYIVMLSIWFGVPGTLVVNFNLIVFKVLVFLSAH